MAQIGKGDEVSWNTSQGTTHGEVVDEHTRPFTFDGQQFNASEDEPYVVIESAKTGKKAAHKVSSVRKRS